MDSIRILVADDDELTRDVLTALIDAAPELELVEATSDAISAVAAARRRRPHVVLADVEMPGGGGQHVARELASDAEIRVVALSSHDETDTVIDMLQSGACGYLIKESVAFELIDTIKRVARGESVLSPSITGPVLGLLRSALQQGQQERDERVAQEARIHSVLSNGHITCVYQPLMSLDTRRTVGFEALSRFDGKPVRGPDAWFDEATSIGRGPELELLAIRSAIREFDAFPDPMYLAINMSPETLIDRELGQVLEEVSPYKVVLEITEHEAIKDYPALIAAIEPFRDRGIRVSVDDVGAGFASLTHIVSLEPDFIKIDISLIRGIDQDASRSAMAASLVAFAHQIGAQIVAEGIETESELAALTELGVPVGQGYLLGRPMGIAAALKIAGEHTAQNQE